MRKRSIKAFTLIELIVVMGIMGILMTAIIQFFGPVNKLYDEVYRDDKTMSIVNGVNRYIGESMRYSKYVMIYVDYKEPPPNSEVLADIRALDSAALSTAKISDSTLSGQIKGVYINNTSPTTYNNKSCTGRVYKLKNFASGTTRLALTSSYYGESSLFISIPRDTVDSSKLQIDTKTVSLNTSLLNTDGTIYSDTASRIDFPNMNSIINGQIGYKTDSFENTYIYYISAK